ncbi:tyrosine-protein phosphatase non-receptor type substrate 1-like isoform X2 [Heterodontus francisci]|uniref:tyrosine-protein phosphatase non-receptor type substrate 1-like isoform X2 n=1 Tax=Heterodontus francisci TaxID=7792 RepID=UPI00355B2D83
MTGALWSIYFLGILYPVPVDTSGKVTPGMAQMKALRGTNITLKCPFPFHLDYSNVKVYWLRKENGTLLQEDSRTLFQVKKGGAYLQLLNVTMQDAGTYQCGAKYHDQMVVKGTLVQLVVYAAPTPMNIVCMPSEPASSIFLRLQCRTAAFYPKEFNLTWHKNGTEIVAGFRTEQKTTEEGLYKAISSLDETQPIEHGTVYTCHVYHISNSIPANANYTAVNKDVIPTNQFSLIAGCAAGAVTIVMLTIMIVKRLQIITSKVAKRNSLNPTQNEGRKEQGAADNNLTYAALDLIDSKKTVKPKQREESTVYAETKHRAADSKLTYAALSISDSKKASKRQQDEARPIYAVKEQGAADNNLTYAALDLIDSKKTVKPKQREESTVYAETKHRAADSKLTYAALSISDSKKASKRQQDEARPIYAVYSSSKYIGHRRSALAHNRQGT